MLKLYGIIGFVLIILCEINFVSKLMPYSYFYFLVIWLGYILFVDSIVYYKYKKSLVMNNIPKLIGMFIISIPFWKMFEYINIIVKNWYYVGGDFFGQFYDLMAVISFSTVIPAFFVTLALFNLNIKDSIPKEYLSNKSLFIFILIGILFFILPLIYPKYFFPLLWIFLIFIIDPINYRNKRPSVFYLFKSRNFRFISAIIISILLMGFLWEFWNYFAVIKWIYTVPYFVDFLHIFEMPILGYLGYIPFGFEIFSFYYFIEYLFSKK